MNLAMIIVVVGFIMANVSFYAVVPLQVMKKKETVAAVSFLSLQIGSHIATQTCAELDHSLSGIWRSCVWSYRQHSVFPDNFDLSAGGYERKRFRYRQTLCCS